MGAEGDVVADSGGLSSGSDTITLYAQMGMLTVSPSWEGQEMAVTGGHESDLEIVPEATPAVSQ